MSDFYFGSNHHLIEPTRTASINDQISNTQFGAGPAPLPCRDPPRALIYLCLLLKIPALNDFRSLSGELGKNEGAEGSHDDGDASLKIALPLKRYYLQQKAGKRVGKGPLSLRRLFFSFISW